MDESPTEEVQKNESESKDEEKENNEGKANLFSFIQ